MANITQPKIYHIDAGYKMVDTCAGSFAANSAGEFNAETPYFYSAYKNKGNRLGA